MTTNRPRALVVRRTIFSTTVHGIDLLSDVTSWGPPSRTIHPPPTPRDVQWIDFNDRLQANSCQYTKVVLSRKWCCHESGAVTKVVPESGAWAGRPRRHAAESNAPAAHTVMRVTTTLISVQRQLAQTLDAETIPQIVAARKMSQANNAQRAQREAAMQVALRTAADVPLEVMRLSALGLEQAQTVAARGCRAASTDTELAVALLRIGLIGARPTLEQKLGSLTDETYTQTVIDEIVRLSDEGTNAANAAEAWLRVPPA